VLSVKNSRFRVTFRLSSSWLRDARQRQRRTHSAGASIWPAPISRISEIEREHTGATHRQHDGFSPQLHVNHSQPRSLAHCVAHHNSSLPISTASRYTLPSLLLSIASHTPLSASLFPTLVYSSPLIPHQDGPPAHTYHLNLTARPVPFSSLTVCLSFFVCACCRLTSCLSARA
jgi:hypothetical protein